MTSQQRELFRQSLLRTLEANESGRGIGVQALQVLVGAYGFSMPPIDDVKREMAYLEDKTFVAVVGKAISPENKTWRITAAGRDELATHG